MRVYTRGRRRGTYMVAPETSSPLAELSLNLVTNRQRGRIFCPANFNVKDAQECYLYLFLYKLIYKAPKVHNFKGAVSSQRWPKPFLVLVDLPTEGGQAELA